MISKEQFDILDVFVYGKPLPKYVSPQVWEGLSGLYCLKERYYEVNFRGLWTWFIYKRENKC